MASNEKYINNYFANSDRYTIDRDTIDRYRKLKVVSERFESPSEARNAEEEYFGIYGCKNEKEKLLFEISYVKRKLNTLLISDKDKRDYESSLDMMKESIIRKDELPDELVGTVKRALLFIEIKNQIPISFFTEVKACYLEELSELKDKRDNYGRTIK